MKCRSAAAATPHKPRPYLHRILPPLESPPFSRLQFPPPSPPSPLVVNSPHRHIAMCTFALKRKGFPWEHCPAYGPVSKHPSKPPKKAPSPPAEKPTPKNPPTPSNNSSPSSPPSWPNSTTSTKKKPRSTPVSEAAEKGLAIVQAFTKEIDAAHKDGFNPDNTLQGNIDDRLSEMTDRLNDLKRDGTQVQWDLERTTAPTSRAPMAIRGQCARCHASNHNLGG